MPVSYTHLDVYKRQVYAGRNEDRMLQDPSLNLTGTLGTEQMTVNADYLVRDGELLHLIGFDWKVLETPGLSLIHI